MWAIFRNPLKASYRRIEEEPIAGAAWTPFHALRLFVVLTIVPSAARGPRSLLATVRPIVSADIVFLVVQAQQGRPFRRCQMTSIADRIAGPPLAGAANADVRDADAAAPAIVIAAAGERELRLDLFRGMALWLIFIDHLPPNILTWFTIRNYGFSDATEIFIFISGYTAAFVYGRAMVEAGFVVATARIMRRVWQIYVAHVFLFTIFLAEISYVATRFENPLYSEEMGIMDFLKQPDVAIMQAL